MTDGPVADVLVSILQYDVNPLTAAMTIAH